MSVTVTADVVSLFQQALHYVRIEFVKFSGKEECPFDTLLFQGTDDGVRSVRSIGGGEYERDLFFGGVGTYNAAIAVDVLICCCVCLLHSVFLQRR